ncbi:MAG: hypothetical protein R2812_04790 [Gelidibacter sp.]
MRYLQKIILLVVTVPFALFPGGFLAYVFLYQTAPFKYRMLVPIAITVCGICTFIFHLKSKNIYKLLDRKNNLPKIELVFWVLVVAFGMAYVALACFILYYVFSMEIVSVSEDYWQVLLVFLPLIIFGLWTVADAFYLKHLMNRHQNTYRYSEIEDIKGQGID